MTPFLIASRNPHKVREIKDLFACFLPELEIDFFTLKDFPSLLSDMEEDDSLSLEAITEKKALTASSVSKMICLADTSDLVVPALLGSFTKQTLKQQAGSLKEHEKDAYYICAISIALPDRIIRTSVAKCEGFISEEPRGSHGFGYDELFVRHDYQKTFAELEPAIKVRTSHRSKAFVPLVETLKNLLTAH